jgi:hypothetical protein
MGKNEIYELESLLYEIDIKGFVVIPLIKLYRLLGKGNRSAGTWKSLLDVWEGLEGDRDRWEIYIFETQLQDVVISKFMTKRAGTMAGESLVAQLMET